MVLLTKQGRIANTGNFGGQAQAKHQMTANQIKGGNK